MTLESPEEGRNVGHGNLRHTIALWVGALGFLCAIVLPSVIALPEGLSAGGLHTLGLAFCMGTWWIASDLPLAVPALLPLAAYPLLGIAESKVVSQAYADRVVLLLLSGFLLALSVETSGLHRRLALSVLSRMGDRAAYLSLGVILVTSGISGWISNTAAVLMMLPIVLAMVDEGASHNDDPRANRNFAAQMLLGVAWAASIGGIGTPVGTPPNLIFQTIHEQQFPDAERLSFPGWMALGVPTGAVLALLCWWLLARVLAPVPADYRFGGRQGLERDLAALGPARPFEVRAAIGFGTICLLWVIRPLLERWGLPKGVDDTTIGAIGLVAFFLCPAGGGTGRNLLTWEEGKKAPWDLFLLFGGGIALSMGFEKTGLTTWLAQQLTGLLDLPQPVLIAAVCALVLAVTELASNTATAAIVLPVLAAMARASDSDPLLLMVPATFMASLGFAMPVGTAPNALVIGTGRVQARTMMRMGVVLDLIALVVVVAAMSILR